MALNGLFCADVPLRYYSLTHSSSPGGSGTPSNTMCHWTLPRCTCQMASKSVERLEQGAETRQMTDRWCYGEMGSYRRNRLC